MNEFIRSGTFIRIPPFYDCANFLESFCDSLSRYIIITIMVLIDFMSIGIVILIIGTTDSRIGKYTTLRLQRMAKRCNLTQK